MRYYKINTKRSFKGNLGLATYASMIRNNHGDCITNCIQGLGVTSNFVVELCELGDELLLA